METTHFYRLEPGKNRDDALRAFREREHRRATDIGDRYGVGPAEAYHLIADQL
jgi:hypothetical protein